MHPSVEREADKFCKILEYIEENIIQKNHQPKDFVINIEEGKNEACKALSKVSKGNQNLTELYKYFRESISPRWVKSWFIKQAITKPKGYPGDYEILEGIYDKKTRSEGIGETLDLYFLQTDLATGVQNRKNKLREILDDISNDHSENLSIFNIACGPCREIAETTNLRSHPNLKIVGIDLDEDSLAYAKNKLLSNGFKEEQIRLEKYNALKLVSKEKNLKHFGKFDLIYSIGLFDYLSDKVLKSIVSGTIEMLNPNGKYIIAFKDCSKYDKTGYEWFVDWHFYQRTEDDCRNLLSSSLTDYKIAVERDASGIIMFFILGKFGK